MSDYLDRLAKVAYCDVCRKVVDQQAEPGRWRHLACPVPALPQDALDVIARTRGTRKSK